MNFFTTLLLCLAAVAATNKVNIERSKPKSEPEPIEQIEFALTPPDTSPTKTLQRRQPKDTDDEVDLTGLPDDASWQKIKSFRQNRRNHSTERHGQSPQEIVGDMAEGGFMKHCGLTLIGHRDNCEAVADSYSRLSVNRTSAPYVAQTKVKSILCVGLSDCLGASFEGSNNHTGLIAVDPYQDEADLDETLFHEIMHGCGMGHDQIEILEKQL